MRQAPIAFSRAGFVTAVIVVVVLVACGIGGTWIALDAVGVPVLAPTAARPSRPESRPREIEGISQTLISDDETTAEDVRRDTDRLTSYGWVDADRGIVHIPIERAMAIVAGEQQ